mmetsp:Transcript_30448/g.72454  ORF Transcript_30448/g.72454 Transcript_30448/m.72454 type:complete len:234 (-) Transcript_30448:2143-2844(-)
MLHIPKEVLAVVLHPLHQPPIVECLARSQEDVGVPHLVVGTLRPRRYDGQQLGLARDLRQKPRCKVLPVEHEAEREPLRVIKAGVALEGDLLCDDPDILAPAPAQQHPYGDLDSHQHGVHSEHVRRVPRVDAVVRVDVGVQPPLVAHDDDGAKGLERELCQLLGAQRVTHDVRDRHALQLLRAGEEVVKAVAVGSRDVLAEERDVGTGRKSRQAFVHLLDRLAHELVLRCADN